MKLVDRGREINRKLDYELGLEQSNEAYIPQSTLPQDEASYPVSAAGRSRRPMSSSIRLWTAGTGAFGSAVAFQPLLNDASAATRPNMPTHTSFLMMPFSKDLEQCQT